MISSGAKRRGPEARAPDWHADPEKYAAKVDRDKRERGELVIALGPFCVPCGKRFAKQSVYDAHLAGKKHLHALQRMGREEEAMVCQLDIEAKKRRLATAEQERQDAWRAATATGGVFRETPEDAEAAAAHRAAREEALRKRHMLPMPAEVAAGSVYADPSDPRGDDIACATSAAASLMAHSTQLASEAVTDDEESPVLLSVAPFKGAFVPSATWGGARPAMVFKMGTLGCGYYEDALCAQREASDEVGCEAATP
mmetsp:Transcript_53999/g.139479  ORF Transcript_53999/g.139479 Transcript_53999/m.139479 type:complete len:255 (+) Transcript_53999:325-1089(+)